MAQEQLSFPFQGGKAVMTQFFKDSLIISPGIIQKKATGTAVFKFTANEKGAISKIIIYYADDALLAAPIIGALKKSNYKWIIPDHEKTHDFIIPFTISFNRPAIEDGKLRKTVYENYINRKPIISTDQVPLDEATLLPGVVVSYDILQ
ncbi:MAG TPA: hypothetical protein DCO83_05040 [Mucilaginibacter sp.]|nr:hypothetical protein [Mucilaginibacter sp.]